MTTLGIIISVASGVAALLSLVISWIAYKRKSGNDSKEQIEQTMVYRLKVDQHEDRLHDIENKTIVELKYEMRGLRKDIKEVLDQIIEIYKGK